MEIENGGWQTLSSSPVAPFAGMSIPKTLSIEAINQIKNDFKSAALRSVKAGFDITELHFAHGYLVHHFYQNLSTKGLIGMVVVLTIEPD